MVAAGNPDPKPEATPAAFNFEAARNAAADAMDAEFIAKRTPEQVKANEQFGAHKVLDTVKSLDDLFKMVVHGQKRMGGMVSIPGADAKPEQIAEFRTKMGVPDSPDKYTFTISPAMQRAGIGEDTVKAFLADAHKSGYTQAQIDRSLAWYSDYLGGIAKNVSDEQAAGFAKIKETYPHDYQRVQDVCNQIITRHGGGQIPIKNAEGVVTGYTTPMKVMLQSMGILSEQGDLVNPQFFEFFRSLEPSMREARMISDSGDWTRETPVSVDAQIAEVEGKMFSKEKPMDMSSDEFKRLKEQWNALHKRKYELAHPAQ